MILKECGFVCPVCREKLFSLHESLRCLKGHSFDTAKQGYTNLLLNNSSGKRHGDDRLMVKARTDFLEKGYYAPLREKLKALIGNGNICLDSGCGEGYYTSAIAENNRVFGIDISKDALKQAAKCVPNGTFAVASIADIPLPNCFADVILNVFAPDGGDEFKRILKSGGRLITVEPTERHLFELKEAVYDSPYLNPTPKCTRDGYSTLSTETLEYEAELESNQDIVSLFKMTPYYYKTGQADQEKLAAVDKLKVTVGFAITQYEKR